MSFRAISECSIQVTLEIVKHFDPALVPSFSRPQNERSESDESWTTIDSDDAVFFDADEGFDAVDTDIMDQFPTTPGSTPLPCPQTANDTYEDKDMEDCGRGEAWNTRRSDEQELICAVREELETIFASSSMDMGSHEQSPPLPTSPTVCELPVFSAVLRDGLKRSLEGSPVSTRNGAVNRLLTLRCEQQCPSDEERESSTLVLFVTYPTK